MKCPHLDNIGGCCKTIGHKKCSCSCHGELPEPVRRVTEWARNIDYYRLLIENIDTISIGDEYYNSLSETDSKQPKWITFTGKEESTSVDSIYGKGYKPIRRKIVY